MVKKVFVLLSLARPSPSREALQRLFSALRKIASPSFSGSPPSPSLPFIMCGETCDDAKLAMAMAAVDGKVDAALAIVAQ